MQYAIAQAPDLRSLVRTYLTVYRYYIIIISITYTHQRFWKVNIKAKSRSHYYKLCCLHSVRSESYIMYNMLDRGGTVRSG